MHWEPDGTPQNLIVRKYITTMINTRALDMMIAWRNRSIVMVTVWHVKVYKHKLKSAKGRERCAIAIHIVI